MAAPESDLSRWASRLRAVTFVALSSWILLAPGYVQVLGGSQAIARPWVMYSRPVTSVVVAELRVQRTGGRSEMLDRHGLASRTASATPARLRGAERGGRPLPPEHGDLWGLRLIALQLSAVDLWSAFDKMNPAFQPS